MLMTVEENLPLAEVQAHLPAVVDRVVRTRGRITIVRDGKPDAVVLSLEDLLSLEETLEALSDPEALSDIVEGLNAAARGEGLNEEQLRERYLGGRS